MIDTDKYEGHTPAPWLATHDRLEHGWVVNHDGWRVWVGEKRTDAPHLQNNRFGSESLSEADAQLIADAPLLLERVIHLEHILKCAKDVLTNIYTYDKDLEDAEWIAWFCDMEEAE
tara:strand:- start:806 stop:1153 length:348 start_codon:yes stop_codon:yes gene_type:complete